MILAASCLLALACGRIGFDSQEVGAIDGGWTMPSPPDAAALCDGGPCVSVCPSGQTLCSGTCTNTDTDLANCGTCSNVCQQTQTCSIGICTTGMATELLSNGDFSSGLPPWSTSNNPMNSDDIMVVWVLAAGQVNNGQSGGPNAKILTQDFVVPNTLTAASFSLDFHQNVFGFVGEIGDAGIPELGDAGIMGFGMLDPENVLVIEADPLNAMGDTFENALRIDIVAATGDAFYEPILFELYIPTMSVGEVELLELVTIDDPALLTFLQGRTGDTLRLRIAQVESTFPWPVLVDNLSLAVVTP